MQDIHTIESHHATPKVKNKNNFSEKLKTFGHEDKKKFSSNLLNNNSNNNRWRATGTNKTFLSTG